MKNIELIINWIKETINKEKIKFKLIFKMSENGTKSEDFHKTCDNQGPTLTLVKTTKNKIFGGFTPLNWLSEGGGTNDPTNQTFIFSLNLKKNIICSEKMVEEYIAQKIMAQILEIATLI